LTRNPPPETRVRGRAEAVRWARDAAARDLAEGLYAPGMMRGMGHGLSKDLAQARLSLHPRLASDHVPEAHHDRRELEKKMTSAEIEEARRLTKEGKPTEPGIVLPAWSLPGGIKTVPINGYPMAYLERGAGMTLVLVHGALNDCRYWEPQLASLSSDRRVIAVSLRHHFPEPWNGQDGSYSIKIHAEDLARFIEAIGGGPVDLVGHSRGGAVAAMMALSRPDLVRKLVLAEPAILSLIPPTAGAAARVEGVKQLNARFARGEIEPALEFYIDSVNGPGTWKDRSEEVRQFARDNAWTISRQATDTERIGKDGIAALKVPVLLIGGEKSHPLFAGILNAAREVLPTAEREILPDAAHRLNRDHPAAFDRALLKFLTK
jgi:pimeloyl-ACP methyl ester carboxylesterase